MSRNIVSVSEMGLFALINVFVMFVITMREIGREKKVWLGMGSLGLKAKGKVLLLIVWIMIVMKFWGRERLRVDRRIFMMMRISNRSRFKMNKSF